MKTIINENQRGIVFKNGKFIKVLEPGKHLIVSSSATVKILNINDQFDVEGYDLTIFMNHNGLKEQLEIIEVADQTLALHYVDGRFTDYLTTGKYAFWNIAQNHKFEFLDMRITEVSDDVPRYIFNLLPRHLYYKVEVTEYQKARLYYDQKFVKLLDEGIYYYWENGTRVKVDLVDTRLLQINIVGQEMLTMDKVSLRINFVCSYKITDYIKISTEIDDYEMQMHVTLQLLLREYVGKYRLDEILENRNQIADYVFQKLKEKEENLYVKFYEAGVKDIILPGEIRAIMNTVLIAEKKAQANVIARREEVASTRSLLNTAKLMDENQTLFKLKELEYLEKICENVGSITVSGGSDLLSQLTQILKGA